MYRRVGEGDGGGSRQFHLNQAHSKRYSAALSKKEPNLQLKGKICGSSKMYLSLKEAKFKSETDASCVSYEYF